MGDLRKHIVFSVLFFTISFGFGQEPHVILSGTVISNNNEVEGINILNLTSSRGTISDSQGRFSIGVVLNDTLLFSSVQLKRKYLIVTKDILSSFHLKINLEELVNELDEVVVRRYNLTGNLARDISALALPKVVNASSLGLPNADVIPRTQNERRLFEADHGKFIELNADYTALGFTINLHKILNRVTGRTKKLGFLVELDEQDIMFEEVLYLINHPLLLKELKIPLSKKEQFFTYCQADPHFAELVEAKDHLEVLEFFKKKGIIFISENNSTLND